MGLLDKEYKLSNAEWTEFGSRKDISYLSLDKYDSSAWFVQPVEVDEKVPTMQLLEGDKEVKEKN